MTANPYETTRYLREYLLFHYGRPKDLCPFPCVPRDCLRFHARIREECVLPVRSRQRTCALDVGCAVGRFSFELGRVVDHALGVDNSASFIQAAQRMARRQHLTVRIPESGAQTTRCQLDLPAALRRSTVEFQVGDALNLSEMPESHYHIVSAINLLDRLPRPRRFLLSMHQLVAPGGQLIIASPFTWLEEYTPRDQWLDHEDVAKLLSPFFRLARCRDIPFLIREHRRKYQFVVSHVLTFRRRL